MYTDSPARKIALVMPENLFVNAFFEASRAQETIDVTIDLQYFDDHQKALDWLESV